MTPAVIIEIRHLGCRYPDGTRALSDISLDIPEGQFVVLAGANGCGKTTLLRHLNGLIPAREGTVKIAGVPVSENPARARQLVGMVFQEADSQIVGETVREDAAFGPENLCLSRSEIDRRVTAALLEVGLGDVMDRRPHLLSGGEKRRLAIAGVLAMNPRIIVLDEPFSNLDYPGVRQVLDQLRSLHRNGRTLLVTTHDLDKVLALAERLIVMAHGRIVKDGPPGTTVRGVEEYGVREPAPSGRATTEGCPYMAISSWLS